MKKTRRSLAHRRQIAGTGPFKPIASFAQGASVVILGPNGVGKTMLLRNLADRALHAGHDVVVRTAGNLLADLIKQEFSVARARRLAAYVRARLLCINEASRAPS